MRQKAVFLAYAIPYVVLVGVCVVVGAAFFVPDLLFGTLGTTELVVIVLVGGASLVVILTTSEQMIEAGREMIDQRYEDSSHRNGE